MNDIIDLLKSRYSARKFKPDPIEDEKLMKIIESARVAPSAMNYQPTVLYIVKKGIYMEKLAKATPCTFNAPVVFVVCNNPSLAAGGKRREGDNFGEVDATIACTQMMLEAESLGLGSCMVGRFNADEVKETLGLPEELDVTLLLPVGYREDDCKPSSRHEIIRPEEETVFYL